MDIGIFSSLSFTGVNQTDGLKSKMWRRHIPYWVNFMAQNIRCKQRDYVKNGLFLDGVTWRGHRYDLLR